MYPGFHAAATPDHPAIVMAGSGERVSYRELDERSNRLARLWWERGLRRGDHVAIVLENHPRYFDAVWAALRSGLYYTPVNWHLTAPEIEYIVRDCGARSILTSASLASTVTGLETEIPLVLGGEIEGWEPYEVAVAGMPSTPLDDEPEGIGMFYSSGTTGRPKGIVFPLPGGSVRDGPSMAVDPRLGMSADDVYLSPAPLYHAAPVVTCSLVHRQGGTAVILERWDAEACLAAIERHHCNRAQFVPTMFVRLLKLPQDVRDRYDVTSLRHATHAAAPCPVEVKRRMIEWWGPIVWEYYSSSENIGSTIIGPEEWLAHPGSVGRPSRSVVHICDDDHRPLPPGEIGIVWFETPGATFEYKDDPEKTASSRSPEGWFTIGDIGYVDEDGYLYLTDRKAFTIISGGVNIYPQEAENVLVLHPAVADVAVIGVPNADLGEEAKAVVQLLEPDEAGPEMEAELLAFCRERLAAFKCPRSIDFEARLPREDNGKLYKRLLKDRYWVNRPSRII
ncbi:MAG: long-chain acyl-CoA synthetase [Acidimicrobiaceae bacterium]|jgi:acyl-CoA synthetase (AMP-forming)/AMP-acid ligase II